MPTLRRVPQEKFGPVGQCIYCGDTSESLSDEHIVPYGLAGHLLLPKSSCSRCAAITHAYEYTVQRPVLGNVRMRFGFPTRRPKERPKFIEIGTIHPNGRRGRLKVPMEEYPIGSVMPHYGRANIFLGGLPSLNTLQHGAAVYANADIEAFTKKYDWDGNVTLGHHPIQFGQMIIKICYGLAVAALGIGSFEPICLDQILSKDINISHVFGQCGQNNKAVGPSPLFNHRMIFRPVEGGYLLFAHFSLFPGAGTPIYEVALGYITKPEQIAVVERQIEDEVLRPFDDA